MHAHPPTERPWLAASLPLVAICSFLAILGLLSVLEWADGPRDALWAIGLWGAVGFVAVVFVSRIALLAVLIIRLLLGGLQRAVHVVGGLMSARMGSA